MEIPFIIPLILIGTIFILLALSFIPLALDTVEYVACSFSVYFMIYVLVSSGLFLFHLFSVERCVLLTTIVTVPGFVVTYLRNGRKTGSPNKATSFGSAYVLLAILVGALFAAGSFEFYGMGQDEGVYQTEAINLLYGNTEWSYSIHEYNVINDPDYKDYYYRNVADNLGFDVSSEVDRDAYFLFAENAAEEDAVFGFWHGMPSFASILALSALLFGIENMMLIQFFFYICYGVLCGALLKKTGAEKGTLFLLTLVALICPQIVWASKSALTEMFLAVIIAVYLLLVLQESYTARMLSVLPILCFCFYHISVYIMIPVVLLVYWILYAESKKKGYVYLSYLMVFVYFLSFLYIAYMQPIYTGKNVAGAIPYATLTTQLYFVIAGCLLALLLSWIAGKTDKIHISAVWSARVIVCVCVFGIVYTVFRSYRGGFVYSETIKLALPSFAIITGVFLLPVIIVLLLFAERKISLMGLLIGVLFSWMIIVFSVLKGEVSYYYYYGRYLAPYVLMIPIAYSFYTRSYLEDGKAENDVRKTKVSQIALRFIVPAVSALILLPFTNVIRNNTDDSRLEWDVVSDVLGHVNKKKEEKGASLTIAVDESLVQTLFHPLRAVAGNCFITNSKYGIDYLREEGIHPDLYLTSRRNREVERPESMMLLTYMDTSLTEEDNLSYRSKWLGLPTDIDFTNVFTIFLYSDARTECITYQNKPELLLEGWHRPNSQGYYWTSDDEAALSAYLENKDYLLTIVFGNRIPFAQLPFDEMKVKMSINGNVIHTFVLNESNQSEPVMIKLNESEIHKGYNEFRFETDHMWSPSEFGSEDIRRLGFSLAEVRFEQ